MAFTGHRPNKLDGYQEDTLFYTLLKQAIRHYVRAGYEKAGVTQYISGVALGVDVIAAEIVLEEKVIAPQIQLTCAVPFLGQEARWNRQDQERYRRILSVADTVQVVCAPGYAPWKMQRRNEWMVDRADIVLAVWDGTHGGTGNCVDYARRKEKRIIQIDPSDIRRRQSP